MRNKKRLFVLLGSFCLIFVLVAITFMVACPGGKPESPESVELKCFVYTKGGLGERITGPWIDEVFERTEGRLKISPMYEAVTFADMYDSIIAGTADMGYMWVPGINPGRFSTMETFTVVDYSMTCARPAKVAWELYKEFPEVREQFADTKVLAITNVVPYPPGLPIATVSKPIYKLEDLKGLKFMATGEVGAKRAEAFGASAVQLTPPEFYEACQRGIVDGLMDFDLQMLVSYKLGEVIHHVTIKGGRFHPWWFVMNWDSWNSLPSDLQETLEELSGDYYVDRWDDYMNETTPGLISTATEYGIDVIELPKEELERWDVISKPVQDQFVADLEAKGLPGKNILERISQLSEEYNK